MPHLQQLRLSTFGNLHQNKKRRTLFQMRLDFFENFSLTTMAKVVQLL